MKIEKENINQTTLIIILSLLFFIFILYKDFYNIETLKKITNKIDIKNKYINHIFFAIDTRNYINEKKLKNINSQDKNSKKGEYSRLLKKIFFIIEECIVNQIFTVTIDLLNSYDISVMTYEEIKELVQDKFFWQLLEEFETNMKVKISFLYSDNIPDFLIKRINEFNEKNNDNKKKINIQVNLLLGLDIHKEVEQEIQKQLSQSPSEKINLKKIICKVAPPIDIGIIFSKADISTALLLNIYNNKVILLNYSLEQINKNTLFLLLKKVAHQIDPFF